MWSCPGFMGQKIATFHLKPLILNRISFQGKLINLTLNGEITTTYVVLHCSFPAENVFISLLLFKYCLSQSVADRRMCPITEKFSGSQELESELPFSKIYAY